jgi:hypothetical protein
MIPEYPINRRKKMKMRTRTVVILLISGIIILQAIAILIYLVLDESEDSYRMEYEVDLDWLDSNQTGEEYYVVVPLPIVKESGEDIIQSVDDLELVLGRADLDLIRSEDGSFLNISSDTPVHIIFSYKIRKNELHADEMISILSSFSGNIESGTGSISAISSFTNLTMDISFSQRLEYSNGKYFNEEVSCGSRLLVGEARYPLEEVIPPPPVEN